MPIIVHENMSFTKKENNYLFANIIVDKFGNFDEESIEFIRQHCFDKIFDPKKKCHKCNKFCCRKYFLFDVKTNINGKLEYDFYEDEYDDLTFFCKECAYFLLKNKTKIKIICQTCNALDYRAKKNSFDCRNCLSNKLKEQKKLDKIISLISEFKETNQNFFEQIKTFVNKK